MPSPPGQAPDEAPSPRSIDLSLDDFARELELRARSEAELGPIVRTLLQALSRWSGNPAAPDLIDRAFAARAAYVRAMEAWRPLLEEWIPIRQKALRLEALSDLMSDAQWERFNRLQMLESQGHAIPSTFDEDHQQLRPLLQHFETTLRRR